MPPTNDQGTMQDAADEGLSLGEAQNTLLGFFMEGSDEDVGEPDDGDEDVGDDVGPEHDEEDYDDESDEDYDDEDDLDESEGEVDDDDAESEDPGTKPDQTFKVKVGGEEAEVTLDEALAGYMRQQDYTRKTMETADLRKELETKHSELTGLEQEYVQNLQIVGNVLTGGLGPEPDWAEVKKANPANYATIREAWMERQDQIQAIQAQIQAVQENARSRFEEAKAVKLREERERLRAVIPAWVDDDTFSRESAEIVEAAEEYGISREELDQVIDHRLIWILRDAMRARKQDAASEEGKKVARKTRKRSTTLKPGTRTTPKNPGRKMSGKKVRTARKRLAQSGNIRDAEAAILGLLNIE